MSNNSKKSLNIIMVGDDSAMIELEAILLEEAGHKVVALQTSEGALSKIKEQAPDCVLTEILMPGIDGMQLIKKIKDNPESSNTKVIVVSSKTF